HSYLDADLGAAESAADHSIQGLSCTAETIEAALTKAFHITDEEFGNMGGYEHLALVGTTAVVALVGSRMIYVANCGDSRAVLCRAGGALPLTDDHKAAREDETARVEAAGGQILFWNGVRVMGLLAVSRAIGD
uniref:PP2C family serine/threonine-protein phosphatase n=1 Tax=Klebsiella pneumoniae TaxID=573 RepID=UPI0025A17D51